MRPRDLVLCVAGAGAWAAVAGPQVVFQKEHVVYGADKIDIVDGAFETYIQDQMKEWHVPGLAIALIEGNKTWTKVRFYAS